MKGHKNGSLATPTIYPYTTSHDDNCNQKWVAREWDSVLPIPRLSGQVASLIIAIAAIICFGNSLDGDFVFDDGEAIINNEDLRPETPVWNLLYNDFWGTKLTHNKSHKSYRPVTVLSFRLNYCIAGGLVPHGFHFTNIVLHSLVSVLALPFVNCLFGGKSPRLSFLSALLFAVHPVHTEAVAGVVGRADLLCTVFSFLSLLLYAHAAQGVYWWHHKGGLLCIMSTVLRTFVLSLSMLLCALALFSKEQGITIIGICSAYDIFIVNKINISQILKRISEKLFKTSSSAVSSDYKRTEMPNGSLFKTDTCGPSADEFDDKPASLWHLLIRHAVLFVTAVVLLIIRWRVMGSKQPVFQEVDNPASFSKSVWTRVATYNFLYTLNAWLLVCPEWLCFDWSMGCIPLLSGICDFRLLAVAFFWVTMLCISWQGIVAKNHVYRRNIMISLVVMVVPFLPASNLLFRVGFVLAERVLYMPSLGFCMLVVSGLRQLTASLPRCRAPLLLAYISLVLVFCARSMQRSNQWKDEASLFQSGLLVCPNNAKVHYNVAKNAGDMGNRDLAVQEYRQALALNPKYEQAMNNLANILKDQGKLSEAENLLRSAVRLRPDFAAAWMNLGIVLSSLKKHAEAELSYFTALKHRAHYPDCYYNLGNLYLDQQRHREAYIAWRNATNQRPTFSIAWNNMIVMLDNIGETTRAEAVAQEAIELIPDDAGLHFSLGNMLGKNGQFSAAEGHFLKAVDLDPLNAVFHSNMGVLYHRWKRYDKAEQCYMIALGLNRELKSARENLAMLHRTIAKVRQ